MKLQLVSIFDPRWVGIAWSLDEGLRRAFERLGCLVAVTGRNEPKDFSRRRGDLLLAVAPEWFEERPEADTCAWARRCGMPAAAWLIEKIPGRGDAGEAQQVAGTGRGFFYRHAPQMFDAVFTAHPADVAALEAAGCRNVHWLPFGVDEEMFRPLPSAADVDCGFVGWKVHERRREFYNGLRRRLPFERLGPGLKDRDRRGATEELVRALNRIRVVLNFPNQFTGLSTRVYETLACGRFLLQPRPPAGCGGELPLFEEGEEIVYYEPKDLDGLAAMARHYLAHPDETGAIAAAGRAAVLTRHTMLARAAQIVDVLRADGVL